MDLLDGSSIEDAVAISRPDLVFHLAGKVTGRDDPILAESMIETNTLGLVRLLAALVESEVCRVVVAGSGDAPLRGTPASPYAISKNAARHAARLFRRVHGLSVVEARIFLAYGPGQPTDKLIPYAISSLLHNQRPRLSRCRRRVDPVFIDDVVDGLIRIGGIADIDDDVVDLGSGRGIELRDVVDTVSDIVGVDLRPVYGAIPDRLDEPDEVARAEQTARLLGWRARTGLVAGLTATVDWYRENLRDRS
jgi:UDP-glucose 4-epimerase